MSWQLSAVLLLILLNGFFAMSELAIISARRARLESMAADGNNGARIALSLLADSGRFLSTIQIGITLIGVLAGAVGGLVLSQPVAEYLATFPAFQPVAESLALAIVVTIITYLSLIIGELVPKQLALKNAERIASVVSIPMLALSNVATPLVYLLNSSTNFVLKLFSWSREQEKPVTEEEIKMLISEATDAGVVQRAEREMISSVMRLADLRVQALMTPRPDIEWLDLDEPSEELLEKLKRSPYSRFPVARGELDNLVGILQAKDLLDALLSARSSDFEPLVREPLIVPEGTNSLHLLETLKVSPLHMAIIVDEYGSVEGIITPTDILEAIVGSFVDSETGGEEEVVRREDGSWLMDGGVEFEKVKELLAVKRFPDEGEYHTLAGFILFQMNRVPVAGENIVSEGYRFEIVDMDGHRIDKVLIKRESSDEADEGEQVRE